MQKIARDRFAELRNENPQQFEFAIEYFGCIDDERRRLKLMDRIVEKRGGCMRRIRVIERAQPAKEPRVSYDQARRGMVRGAILHLLAERPMNGYEVINELDHRTGKLSDLDYAEIDRELRAEAIGLMRQLDDAGQLPSHET